MSKPVKVYLMGKLGTLFGKVWELHVKSPAEALQAINANTKKDLQKYLSGPGAKRYYKVAVQSKDNIIDPHKEMRNPSGQGDIYIIPTVKGAGGKNGGLFQAIAGAVLIIVGIIFYAYGGEYAIEAGIGLLLGGIVQMLTPVPNISTSTGSDDDGRRSSFFEGNATAISQGGSVGIVYGRSMVSPMPISLAVKNKDSSTVGASVGTEGCVIAMPYGDGFVNYVSCNQLAGGG